MNASAGIAARITGQYPISVSTSLALEGANGIYEERHESPPPILRFDQCWCNLRTLFRNLMGSLDKVTFGMIHPEEIAVTLFEEMDQISSIIHETSQGRCRVVYYFCQYADLERQYPHATIRTDSTPKQQTYSSIQRVTLALMLKALKDRPGTILTFDSQPRPPEQPGAKILLLTHFALDLCAHRAFKSITLLESHTGRLKDKALWYTKYYQGKDLVMIPFREDLLQVFGDAEIFVPMKKNLRDEIIEIATKMRWSAVTTTDRIRLGVEQLSNPYAKVILKNIITSRT